MRDMTRGAAIGRVAVAACIGLLPLLRPGEAQAWWRGGVYFGGPVVVAPPPVYYPPPPVYYPPPPVYYAPPPYPYAAPPYSPAPYTPVPYAAPPQGYAAPAARSQAGRTCFAPRANCPLGREYTVGATCSCPTNGGNSYGHVG